MAGPRVLTFNFHEPYLCLMAKTGLPITVGLYNDPPLARIWQTRFRPVPENISFLEEQQWRRELAAGSFDVVVAQNETNAMHLLKCDTPVILVCHNRRTFLNTTIGAEQENGVEKYNRLLERLQEKMAFVFISESKRGDYGIPGAVIPPGIDVDEFGGYTGTVPEVLRVGNMMRDRHLMFDVDFQEEVCADLPSRVVGINPNIPNSHPSESFADLLDTYRSLRCCLHVTREAYEDGYNLAMLEAMACGVPVVSLANPTSPLTDGVDGYLSYDAGVLRRRLQDLLTDPDLARTIGERGRETVAAKFPIATFVERWREAIDEAVERGSAGKPWPPKRKSGQQSETPQVPRLRIFIDDASEEGLGRVFEQALAGRHEVALLTRSGDAGPAVSGLVASQDTAYDNLLKLLPESFAPDLYLRLDAQNRPVPAGIDRLACVKVAVLTGRGTSADALMPVVRPFEFTFVAEQAAADGLAGAGVPNVACLSPDLAQEEYATHVVLMVLDALGMFGGYTGESRFRTGGYYRAPRPELAAHVPLNAQRVLDCGCGGGEFGRSLKDRGVREVVGIEIVERAFEMAKQVLDDALLGSIEEIDLPFEDGYFDCIVFGDVLEHLVEPGQVLRKVSRVLADDGVIVASIPNVRFWDVVQMHAEGGWHYQDAGIMDRTHLRFFTAADMHRMVCDAGLEVLNLQPLSIWPAEQLPRNPDGSLTLGRVTISGVSDAEYQDFLTYQYLVVAGKPGGDRLAPAQRALTEHDWQQAYHLAEQASGVDEFDRLRIMAKAMARIGKLDSAEDLYRRALALRPHDSDVAGEFGVLLVAMNRPGDAKPVLERVLAAEPENDRALGALGLAAITEGRAEQAFEYLKKALTARLDNAPLLKHFVQSAKESGRLPETEELLERFADFYPGNAEAVCLFADILRDLGNPEAARERLENLLLLSPGHPEAERLLTTL